MGQVGPLRRREESHEIGFDLVGHRLLGPAEAPGESADMGVDRDPGDTEGIAQHDVRRLAADSRQSNQLIERGRHLATVTLADGLGESLDARGLRAIEADRLDQRLQLRTVSGGVGLGVGVAREEGRGDGVDPLVGALSRQDGGHEELKRVGEIELGIGVRIGLGQDAAHAAGQAGGIGHPVRVRRDLAAG